MLSRCGHAVGEDGEYYHRTSGVPRGYRWGLCVFHLFTLLLGSICAPLPCLFILPGCPVVLPLCECFRRMARDFSSQRSFRLISARLTILLIGHLRYDITSSVMCPQQRSSASNANPPITRTCIPGNELGSEAVDFTPIVPSPAIFALALTCIRSSRPLQCDCTLSTHTFHPLDFNLLVETASSR